MKLIETIARRFGFRPDTRSLRSGVRSVRQMSSATVDRLTGDWIGHYMSADAAISQDLSTLRSRSRALRDDNDYMRRFLTLVRNNVVGWRGILLKMSVREPDRIQAGNLVQGPADENANTMIAAEWRRWSKKQNTCVDGLSSLLTLQRLVMETVPVDGEVIIRKIRGYPNEWGFALQLLENDHLDHTLNRELTSGNRIRMGVETDAWGRPAAYHVIKRHPGDSGYAGVSFGDRWERVPASDIVHLYIRFRPEQTRGVPWIYTTGRRLHMLGTYEQSEMVAAKIGASKMGFFTQEAGLGGTRYPDDDPNGDSEKEMEVAPGTFEELPAGLKVESWDPQHPNTNYPAFVKSVLRGVAAGLSISYHSLAGDLEAVNFSSGRLGAQDDRDYYRTLQGWIIEDMLEPIFADWLEIQLLTGKLPFPMTRFSKFNAPSFRGRRWPYVDPEKEQNAAVTGIQNRLTSRTRILAEQADAEFEEVAAELAREEAILKQLGLPVNGGPGTPSKEPAVNDLKDPPEPEDPEETEDE